MVAFQHLLNFFYPPECLSCADPVVEAQTFCSGCFQNLSHIHTPLCEMCGYPLEDVGDARRCIPCIAKPPPYILRSALKYNDLSKDVILKLKYFDRMDLAGPLSRFLYQAAHPYLGDIDFFIPVPLHWKRLWKRRYNQATELAHQLSRSIHTSGHGSIPVLTQVLTRQKQTDPQGLKSYLHRMRNMQGAFTVRDGRSITGKRVALIDDVYTTGATLKACARVLEKAGVQEIYAFTVVRVIKGELHKTGHLSKTVENYVE